MVWGMAELYKQHTIISDTVMFHRSSSFYFFVCARFTDIL